MNGLVAILMSSALPVMDKLSLTELNALARSLALTGYANTVASIVAAMYSVRGFAAAGGLPNRIANVLFSIAIGTIAHAVSLLIKGASA